MLRSQGGVRPDRVLEQFQSTLGQGMVRSRFQRGFQQFRGFVITSHLDVFLAHGQAGIRNTGFQKAPPGLHIGSLGQGIQAFTVKFQSLLVLALGILLTRLIQKQHGSLRLFFHPGSSTAGGACAVLRQGRTGSGNGKRQSNLLNGRHGVRKTSSHRNFRDYNELNSVRHYKNAQRSKKYRM